MGYYSPKKKWAIKSWKDMKETSVHMTEWKKPIWKCYRLYDSNSMTFWKRQNYGDSKKSSGCQGLVVGRNKEVEHRGVLGQWNYSVWHYNDECMSLAICPNPQNVQHREWPLTWTMDSGWWWRVSVGSSVVKHGPPGGDADSGGSSGGWRGYTEALSLLLNFIVNLKPIEK